MRGLKDLDEFMLVLRSMKLVEMTGCGIYGFVV